MPGNYSEWQMIFFFYILFHRNIPVVFSDVVVGTVVDIVVGTVVDIVVGTVVGTVVVVNTVPGVFSFFFKPMVVPIIIPNIIRTPRIIKNIIHIVFLLPKCSHLE
jgi:hypothetical protein